MEDRRVTVREAAILLGISEGAIRKRVDRGTLNHEKGEDGRVYVFLPGGVDPSTPPSTPPESNTLISEMRSRIDFLEEELRRKDAILLNMTEAVKALNPPTDPRDAPQSAAEEPGKGDAPTEPGREDPRPWWRRIFGG